MDATTNGLLIAAITTLVGNIIKLHFDERQRRLDREEDRKDRKAAADLTAEHRAIMAQKLDDNTLVTACAAEHAQVAAERCELIAEQTNGMQEKLQELSREAGFRAGAESVEKPKPT